MRRLSILGLLIMVLFVLVGCGTSEAENSYNAGLQKQQSGDLDGALLDYNQAINLDPNLFAAYLNRGAVYVLKSDFAKAVDDETKAIDLKPSDVTDQAKAYTNRGFAYIGNNNLDSALNDFNQAISVKPDYSKAYLGRGLIYANQQKKDEAKADFQKVIDLNQDANTVQQAKQQLDQINNQ